MLSDFPVDPADSDRQIVNEGFETFLGEICVDMHLVDERVSTGDKVFQPVEQRRLTATVRPSERREDIELRVNFGEMTPNRS
jgi:hypothetical protein